MFNLRPRKPGRMSAMALLCFALVVETIQSQTLGEISSPSQPILHLVNDGFLPGQLLDTDRPNLLRWKSRSFTKPFEFPIDGVSTAQFSVILPRPQPTGEYCIELSGGDVLYGSILEFSASSLLIKAANAGPLHVKRTSVQRIYRWQETSLIYLGPSGLDGWGFAMPGVATEEFWTSDGGWPRTSTENASLFRDFELPARSAIEFELSWNNLPDFEFVLGPRNLRGIVDAAELALEKTPVEDAFRFEVWDRELVVVGESERDADVASITPIASGPGAVRIQLYLDQEKQRLSIYSRTGEQTASVKLHSKNPEVRTGLRLTNRQGDIRLKHLRIAHWDGILPQDVQADKSRIHQIDGTITYGQVTAYDAERNFFTLKQDEATVEIDAASVSDVFLSPARSAKNSNPVPNTRVTETDSATPGQQPSSPPPVAIAKVTCQDGSQFSGRLAGVQNGNVHLNSELIDEPVQIALRNVRSIAHKDHEKKPLSNPTTSGRTGRMEADGVKLPGRLLDGTETANASCLVWHPDFSANSSPLAKQLSGRIVYREPPKPKVTVAVRGQLQQLAVRRINQKPAIQGFGDVFKKMLTGKIAPAKKPEIRLPQTLHLRSGDTIPCEVVSVDEEGLHFTTPLSDATFVANNRIKGVELDGKIGSPTLEETKRKRLLTLPRLQKGSPPTHLIYAENGDFLRGRLVGMDQDTLTVEVRLANRKIPRSRVSQIIWLHADELKLSGASKPQTSPQSLSKEDEQKETAPTLDPANTDQEFNGTRIQTLVRHKDRLTFFASKVEDSQVSGSSDILGECHSEIADVDQLLFGDYIEQAAAKLAYHRWKLHYATEPKFVLAGADGENEAPITGTESPLVGQTAPDFKLDHLDGEKFQLAKHRGEIIVLDFWATWCHPCLQTMPLVDEVVREFPDQKVRLLAVNMEEQPDEIKSTLERHKLDVPVILDRDGVAAARYSVTSIPQTVVIDREGNISRLFIGGGPKLVEPLRQALQELTDPDSSTDETKVSPTEANES